MKKNRYDVEVLTRAIDILERIENYNHDRDYSFGDLQIFSGLSFWMKKFKIYLCSIDDIIEKQKTLEVFQIITEISFDKLEKDVMGVN